MIFFSALRRCWSEFDHVILTNHPILWTLHVHYVIAIAVPIYISVVVFSLLAPVRINQSPDVEAVFILLATASGIALLVWALKIQQAEACRMAPAARGWFASRLLCIAVICAPPFIAADLMFPRFRESTIVRQSEAVLSGYMTTCQCLELLRKELAPSQILACDQARFDAKSSDCAKTKFIHETSPPCHLLDFEFSITLDSSDPSVGSEDCLQTSLGANLGTLEGYDCNGTACLETVIKTHRYRDSPWNDSLITTIPGKREHLGGFLALMMATMATTIAMYSTWRSALIAIVLIVAVWLSLSLVGVLMGYYVSAWEFAVVFMVMFVLGPLSVLWSLLARRVSRASGVLLAITYLLAPIIPVLIAGCFMGRSCSMAGCKFSVLDMLGRIIDADGSHSEINLFSWVIISSFVFSIIVVAVISPLLRRWVFYPADR